MMSLNQTQMSNNPDAAPWFRQPIFWILMSGPILVVIAALISFGFAQTHTPDMVSDDYYKDGKHINLQLDRDQHATERGIMAQVMFNPEGSAVKVFLSGKIDEQDGVFLRLLHPARQAQDRYIPLKHVQGNEYVAHFDALPKTHHWYVRLEDGKNVWRVERQWLPSQGGAIALNADTSEQAASAAK